MMYFTGTTLAGMASLFTCAMAQLNASLILTLYSDDLCTVLLSGGSLTLPNGGCLKNHTIPTFQSSKVVDPSGLAGSYNFYTDENCQNLVSVGDAENIACQGTGKGVGPVYAKSACYVGFI